MSLTRTLLKSARLFHLYSGVFLTPALLFFAVTGGVQTFSLHETTRGSNYKPPAILVELGQLHKKQTIVVPERKGPPPQLSPDAKQDKPEDSLRPAFDPSHLGDHTNQQKHDRLRGNDDAKSTQPTALSSSANPQQPAPVSSPSAPPRKHNLIPMKIFFLITSVGLFFSTLTGLYMAYKYVHNKLTITATLAAGIIIPLLLLLF